MAKKILAIIGAIFVVTLVVLGVTTCGVMKIADNWAKEKEPEMRQYVKMSTEDQNAYVEKNMNDLFTKLNIYGEKHPEDFTAEEKENWKKAENAPDAKAAGIQLGRSLVAMFIVSYDPIMNDLSAEDKARYEKEAEEVDARTDAYLKILDKYIPEKK